MEIKLGKIFIDVVQKDIKNLHLSVYPPTGKVRIAAPLRMSEDSIRIYALSKLSWIRKQQQKFINQKRESPRDYINRESHYYLGKRYLLNVIEVDETPRVILKYRTIDLYVRPGSNKEKRQEILENWYRTNLKSLLPEMVAKWEKLMGIRVNELAIKKMKTKWGTCNSDAKRIWINLELAKKDMECIEYIVVHEMVHLLEKKHNDNFLILMNRFLPEWKQYRIELNKMPISHSEWDY